MNHVDDLKNQVNTKTVHLVLLSLITLGIYSIIWLLQSNEKIAQTARIKMVGMPYIIWLAICNAWLISGQGILAFIYDFLRIRNDDLIGMLLLAWVLALIIYPILLIVWAFKAKRAIQEYALNTFRLDLPVNAIYLVIFHLFYINYCINNIPEVARKQAILQGKTPPEPQPKLAEQASQDNHMS